MVTTEELWQMLKDANGNYQAVANRIGSSRQNVYHRLNYTGTAKYNAKARNNERRRRGVKKHYRTKFNPQGK